VRVYIREYKKLDLSNSIVSRDRDYDLKPAHNQIVDGCLLITEDGHVIESVSEWLTKSMVSNDRAGNTAKEYARSIGKFLDFIAKKEINNKRPKPVTSDDYLKLLIDSSKVNFHSIQTYLNIENHGASNQSKSLWNIALKSFFEECLCVDYLTEDDNPYKNGNLFNGNSYSLHHNGVSLDELMALMIVAKDERERCLFQFWYDSGLRVEEIPRVKRADILNALKSPTASRSLQDDDYAYIEANYYFLYVRGTKTRHRDAIKPRNTPISKTTLHRLTRYFNNPMLGYKKKVSHLAEEERPAFLNSHGDRLTKSTATQLVSRRFKEAKRLGLITGRNTLPTHKLRHGFSVSFLSSPDLYKDPVERIQALSRFLGHSSVETTRKHYEDIALEIQVKSNSGEELMRHDKMLDLYNKTKTSEIKKTKLKYINK